MADLFAGVEKFTPGFTGQELSIELGKASAQAFVSGFSAGKGGGGGGGGMGQMSDINTLMQEYGGATGD